MPANRQLRHRSVDASRKLFIRRRKGYGESVSEKKPKGSTAVGIPTPLVRSIQPKKQKRPGSLPADSIPDHYIHAHLCSGAELLSEGEKYDLFVEDMEWLSKTRKKLSKDPFVSENCLEDLIDTFEREAGRDTSYYDPTDVFPLQSARQVASSLLGVHGDFVDLVYRYWVDKRTRLGKALLRRFREIPNIDDPSPHVAFRPRERERRISVRNPRKNDWSSFDKLTTLASDMKNVGNVLDFVMTRESFKRNVLYLDAEVFDQKLELAVKAAKKKRFVKLGALMRSELPRSEYLKNLNLEDISNLVSQNTAEDELGSALMESSRASMAQSYAHVPALSMDMHRRLQVEDEEVSDDETPGQRRAFDELQAYRDRIVKRKGDDSSESFRSKHARTLSEHAIVRKDMYGYLNLEIHCLP